MREKLLDPKLNHESVDMFLQSLGLEIKGTDVENKTYITIGDFGTTYFFKELVDAVNFTIFLEKKSVDYGLPRPNMDKLYPYKVVITKKAKEVEEHKNPCAEINLPLPKNGKTSYTPDTLERAIKLASELKMLMATSHDYEPASQIRLIEKELRAKQEADKNRRI